MKLYIKQKIFSWNDRFSVYDSSGGEIYRIKGALFSFGNKLTVFDANEREVCRIEQEIFRLRQRYHVIKDELCMATVIKEFSLFRPYYTIEGPGLEVQGNFFEHDYEILSGVTAVASVRKQWFTWGDSYEIDVDDAYDPVAVLAVAIIIDCVLESQDN